MANFPTEPCPLCGRDIRASNMETHLDAHARRGDAPSVEGAPAGAEGERPPPIASRAAPAGVKRGSTAKAFDRLESDLTLVLVQMGSAMALALPFSGWFFVQRAPDRARSLVVLAERDERIKKALERMVRASILGVLAGDVADTTVTVGIDLQRIEPDGTFAQVRNITPAYNEWRAITAEGERESDRERDRERANQSDLLAELAAAASGHVETG